MLGSSELCLQRTWAALWGNELAVTADLNAGEASPTVLCFPVAALTTVTVYLSLLFTCLSPLPSPAPHWDPRSHSADLALLLASCNRLGFVPGTGLSWDWFRIIFHKHSLLHSSKLLSVPWAQQAFVRESWDLLLQGSNSVGFTSQSPKPDSEHCLVNVCWINEWTNGCLLPHYTGNSVRGEIKFARFTFGSLAPRVDLVFVELEAYTVLSVLFKK